MKYIRTKDGIYEVDVLSIRYLGETHFSCWDVKHTKIFNNWHVFKQAETIEELIMPGDLVRYDGLYMSWIEKDRGDKIRGIDMHLIPRKSVDMLWIPTGNDTECYPNFKLVASKEDEKGELELL